MLKILFLLYARSRLVEAPLVVLIIKGDQNNRFLLVVQNYTT